MTFLGHTQTCIINKGFQKLYWFKNVDNYGLASEVNDWNIKTLLEDNNGNIITWSIIQFIDSIGAHRKCKMLSKKLQMGQLCGLNIS